MSRHLAERRIRRLVLPAILALALAACAGRGPAAMEDASASPTDRPAEAGTRAATASPAPAPRADATATPAPTPGGSDGSGGGLRMPPEDADHIYLELLGGPDEGNYLAFYDDGTSFCMPGVLAPYSVAFSGSSEGDSGSTLVRFTLLSPDPGTGETSEFTLEMTISRGDETRRYELVPAQGKGSGALSVTEMNGSHDIQILGTMAGDVIFNGGVVCHD